MELHGDGEEVEGEYLFFLAGRPESELLSEASRLASRPGMPTGAYAVSANRTLSPSASGVGSNCRDFDICPDENLWLAVTTE